MSSKSQIKFFFGEDQKSCKKMSTATTPPIGSIGDAPPHQIIFTPGRKQVSIRRYWFLIFVLSLVVAILASLLNGFLLTSIIPVLNLNSNNVKYSKTLCNVTGIKLQNDVTIGLRSVWRGELTVNYLDDAVKTRTATVFDHVSGMYSNKIWASKFLDKYAVDDTIECYVDASAPYQAVTRRPQAVYSSVIFACLLIGVGVLAASIFLCITIVSFAKFVKSREWDECRGVWVSVGKGPAEEEKTVQ
jgi:hypothetical protein